MSSTTLYRVSGLALLIGGLLFILFMLVNGVLYPSDTPPPDQLTSSTWLFVNLMLLLGVILMQLGLPAIYIRQAAQAGTLGLIGFVLLFAAILLVGVFYQLFAVLILPWLAAAAPHLLSSDSTALFIVFFVGGLLFTVGGLLFGIATFRSRVLPRGAALALIIGAILGLLTNAPLPDTFSSIIGTISGVLLALGPAWFGYALCFGHGIGSVRSEQAIKKASIG